MSDATATSDEWQRYGAALVQSMAEVRSETSEDVHEVLLETADYWLSVGLAIGMSDAAAADRLLQVIEQDGAERDELREDARYFVREALP